MQSKDADPEKFFGKLKERMQRSVCWVTPISPALVMHLALRAVPDHLLYLVAGQRSI